MKTRAKWVDFGAIKEQVGMRDILEHYELLDEFNERKNHELVGYCPIHDENQYSKNSFC